MSSLNQNVIRHQIGLLNLATELGNVSRACKLMGLSRDTFYRYQNAMADGGVAALFDAHRKQPNRKNRVEEATEAAVIAYATEPPAHGQLRASHELRQRGIFVSASGVRSIWLRHGLASFKPRRAALETLVAARGIVLTESQVAALEKKQDDDLAHGEIETTIPATWARRTPATSARSRGLGASTSKPLSIPTARWPWPSSTPPRRRSRRPICSTTGYCRSSPNNAWACCAS